MVLMSCLVMGIGFNLVVQVVYKAYNFRVNLLNLRNHLLMATLEFLKIFNSYLFPYSISTAYVSHPFIGKLPGVVILLCAYISDTSFSPICVT
jgi:hypothetical protein